MCGIDHIMDLEDIATLVKDIKHYRKDDEKLFLKDEDLEIGETRVANCLVAQVIFPKAVNREVFRTQLPRILQFYKKVDIEFVGDNTFLMDCTSKIDKNRALRDGPSSFFRDLIVIKELQGLVAPRFIVYDEVSFWVQCHNVPIAFLNISTLEKIDSQIGVVEEVDEGDSGSYLGQYARIRVRNDISKYLKKYFRVDIEEDKEDVFILLAYELLPDFCYKCGIIGHPFRDCGLRKSQYGIWSLVEGQVFWQE